MDEKRISVVVDFDSIQHDPTLAWFKSYLSLRMQVLRIGSVLSDPLP